MEKTAKGSFVFPRRFFLFGDITLKKAVFFVSADDNCRTARSLHSRRSSRKRNFLFFCF